VLEEALLQFSEETGIQVQVQYGGSGTLLGQFLLDANGCDVFLPADDSFVQAAKAKHRVAEIVGLAHMTPVIGVASGNPQGVGGIEDLLRPDLRVGLGSLEATSIGKLSKQALAEKGQWDVAQKHVKVFQATVTELATDLVVGNLDAAIVWDTTCAQFEGMEFVSDPTLTGLSQRVALGIAASTRQPSSALLLARWLQAPERGGGIYTKHAFQRTANGDAWNPRAELVVYAGSMFHAALEDVFQRFEEREGVRVTRIYNGCGILVAQMRSGGEPDAYFSCDSSFLDDIEERFGKRQELSVNPLVLIVPAGNPKGIQGLADLSQAGLDVGLAHPTQSALGRLTQNHLKKLGLWDKIQTSGNVKQDAPQGDFLVNALLTGSLDVALVYASNASLVRESLSVIPLDEGIAAHQPFAIAKDSSHPHLSQRLFDAVLEERERFENLGFRWAHRP